MPNQTLGRAWAGFIGGLLLVISFPMFSIAVVSGVKIPLPFYLAAIPPSMAGVCLIAGVRPPWDILLNRRAKRKEGSGPRGDRP